MSKVGCARYLVLIVGIALFPLCSIQHFIWPLSWCLLADICNHSWIPECGHDELMDAFRLFIDECDLFEYNCDHETDYEVTNYSLCFGRVICPKPKPCPSRPTCPDHRYHRMGEKYVFMNPRRQGRRMNDLGGSTLPMKMLEGKRRYTPEKKKKRRATHYNLRTRVTTSLRTRPKGPPTKQTWSEKTTKKVETTTMKSVKTTAVQTSQTKPQTETLVVKRETIMRNGKVLVKLIARRVNKPGKSPQDNKIDSDFIE